MYEKERCLGGAVLCGSIGIGLYCLWGWNRSIEVGFTVLTTQLIRKTFMMRTHRNRRTKKSKR